MKSAVKVILIWDNWFTRSICLCAINLVIAPFLSAYISVADEGPATSKRSQVDHDERSGFSNDASPERHDLNNVTISYSTSSTVCLSENEPEPGRETYQDIQLLSDLKFAVANPSVYSLDYIHYSALGDARVREQILENIKGEKVLTEVVERLRQNYADVQVNDGGSQFSSDAARIIDEIGKNIDVTRKARDEFLQTAPRRIENALEQTSIIVSGSLRRNDLVYFSGADSEFRRALVHPYALFLIWSVLEENEASRAELESYIDGFLEEMGSALSTAADQISETNFSPTDYYVGWDRELIIETASSKMISEYPNRTTIDTFIALEQWFRQEAWVWDRSKRDFCKRDYSEISVLVLSETGSESLRLSHLIVTRDHNRPTEALTARIENPVWLSNAPDVVAIRVTAK